MDSQFFLQQPIHDPLFLLKKKHPYIISIISALKVREFAKLKFLQIKLNNCEVNK